MFNSFATKITSLSLALALIGSVPAACAQDQTPVVEDDPMVAVSAEDAQTNMETGSDDEMASSDIETFLVVGNRVVDQDGNSLGWISSVIKDELGTATAITVPDIEGEIAVGSLSVENGQLVAHIEKAAMESDETYEPEEPEPVETD